MIDRKKVISALEERRDPERTDDHCLVFINNGLLYDIIALLEEQEPRILSLEEAISGENNIEIDPYVFVEIKDREDIFIGSVNNASFYNYPDLSFGVGECFHINRSYPASKTYPNTDYMKTVRCWTHRPSKEQREMEPWNE